MKKEKYVTPAIEMIEVENESGIMVGSTSGNAGGNYGNGGSMFGTRSTTRTNPYNTSTLSEIEDMINDILTLQGK